jgi:PilZ domain
LERKRREYSRVKVAWPVLIYTGEGLIEGEIRDISLDGALIECARLPNLDHELNLRNCNTIN